MCTASVFAQAITGPALYAPLNGGARILATQGTAASPDIGFSGSGAVPANPNDGGGGNGIFRPAANTMAFSTSSTERMRISSGGAVGIGTGNATPTQRLQISNGNLLLDYTNVGATTGNIFFGGQTYPASQNGMRMSYFNGTSKNGFIDVRTNSALTDGLIFRVDNTIGGTERMRICANGGVAINATNPGTYKLYVGGSAYATGLWVSSDKRFKTNIAPVEQALEKVLQMNGKTYSFDNTKFADRGFSTEKQYGFLAQELQKIMPEAVQEGVDGYLAVNYEMVIPVLVEAMKSEHAIVETLTGAIEGLEIAGATKDAKITELESRLARIEGLLSASETRSQPVLNETLGIDGNRPNPFSRNTTVVFTVPENVKNANLLIFNVQGKELQRIPVSGRGQNTIELQLGNVSDGQYFYSIEADGKRSETRMMIKAN